MCSLKNFVKNTVGLTGKWTSSGGKAKQFKNPNSIFIMTWYPGKQNSLVFNGKEGESFKKILASVLETNFAFKQTDTFLNSSPQTREMSAESDRVIDKSRLTKVSVPLKDMGIEPIADTSTLEELEDFTDSAYYITNVNATPIVLKQSIFLPHLSNHLKIPCLLMGHNFSLLKKKWKRK